jgi:cell division protein FtsI (penicillin-binding protein 3)
MYMLITLFVAGFFAVLVKLFVVQVRDAEKLQEMARIQYESREIIPPMRGLILDRNLSILASNVTEYTLSVDPSVIERPDTVARFIARALGKPLESIMGQLRDTTVQYRIIEKAHTGNGGGTIRRMVLLRRPSPSESRRRYNFNSLAGPVIGYTNVDNRGQSGIDWKWIASCPAPRDLSSTSATRADCAGLKSTTRRSNPSTAAASC